jgi:hypothetical protein
MLRLRDDRVRIKVIPKLSFVQHRGILGSTSGRNLAELMDRFGAPSIGIEVVNLGKFPVTISEVGLREGRWLVAASRAALTMPLLPHGDKWPKKLEPRESVTAYFDVSASRDYIFTTRTRAYATTACDVTRVGTSDALKEWAAVHRRHREWVARNAARA